MMNNQREIYEALLAGETLISVSENKYIMADNQVMVKTSNGWTVAVTSFNAPRNYKIYKEPKWYENILDGGVLCWVNGTETVSSIISYNPEYNHCFTGANDAFLVAKPLTKAEIQVFMESAPDGH